MPGGLYAGLCHAFLVTIFFYRSTKISKPLSRLTALNLTKFVHDVATFNMLLTLI